DVVERVLDVDAPVRGDDGCRYGGGALPAGPAVDIGAVSGVQPAADLPNRLVERLGGEPAVVGQAQAVLLDPRVFQRAFDGGPLPGPILAVLDEIEDSADAEG